MDTVTSGALQPLKTTVELAYQYGISVVLCLIAMGVLVWVLRWVFRTSAAREVAMSRIVENQAASSQKMADAIQANTNALQLFMSSCNTGFDAIRQGNIFQREEHKDLKAAELDTRKEVLDAVRRLEDTLECKAK